MTIPEVDAFSGGDHSRVPDEPIQKGNEASLFSGCSTSLVPWGVPGELITKEPMLGGVSTKRIGAELTATIQ